jgi:hypothetical protein
MQINLETTPNAPFRLNVSVNDRLKCSSTPSAPLVGAGEAKTLPEPVFPQYPQLLGSDNFAPHDFWEQRRCSPPQTYRQMRDGWSLDEISNPAERLSTDHCLSVRGVEVWSRLPLLLGLQ